MARKKTEVVEDEDDLDEELGEDTELDDEDEDEFEDESVDEGDAPGSDDETEADDDYRLEETETVEESAQDRMTGLAADVPVQVVAVLGKRSFSVQDLMKFHVGQVVDLYRPANETVDLVVGGKIIAKGELVSIDGKLGVRVVKLI